jgi:hypothetical protein
MFTGPLKGRFTIALPIRKPLKYRPPQSNHRPALTKWTTGTAAIASVRFMRFLLLMGDPSRGCADGDSRPVSQVCTSMPATLPRLQCFRSRASSLISEWPGGLCKD